VELFHSHRRTRNAIWNATPSNAAQFSEVLRVNYAVSAFFELGRRSWKAPFDRALRKDVDGASLLFTAHCSEERLRKLSDGRQTTRAFSWTGRHH
jgi:hypothetical protein